MQYHAAKQIPNWAVGSTGYNPVVKIAVQIVKRLVKQNTKKFSVSVSVMRAVGITCKLSIENHGQFITSDTS